MALLEISDFASGAVDLPKELKALHCATTTTETTIQSHIMVNGKKNNRKGRFQKAKRARVWKEEQSEGAISKSETCKSVHTLSSKSVGILDHTESMNT